MTGEAIVRLLESQGIQVIRANYQGDVGMHIAKTIHGLTMMIGDRKVEVPTINKEQADSLNEPERVLQAIKTLVLRPLKS